MTVLTTPFFESWRRTLLFALLGCGGLTLAGKDQAGIARTELEAKSRAPAGATTQFTRLPPEETGLTVVNRFDDPRMWNERFQEHAFGSIATGVAAGDYDCDGWPDLVVVQRFGPPKLYRNLGGFKFEDVTARAGLLPDGDEWASGAAFADIDGDGRLDLWLGRHGAPNRVYLNRGDGTFVERAAALGLDQRTSSVMASFIDYDRDGDLDCYLVTNRLDMRLRPGEPDVLLRNEGGHFVDVSRAAGVGGGYQTFAAAWADFDRDGWPDVYVTNDFAGPDQLYRNQHDGTFRDELEARVPLTSYYSMGADIGDINRDGWFDVLVADMLPTAHPEFLANTAELVELQKAEDARTTPQTMRNVLLLNSGAGRFQELAWQAGLAATDWTWAVLLADYDNDGWEDTFFTNGMFRDFMDSDTITKVDRREGPSPAAIWEPTPEMRQANLAFRNRGDVTFEDVSARWGLNEVGISFGAVSVDLDRDGDLDLVVSNYRAPVSVFRNDSVAGHRLLVQLRTASANRFGIGAVLRLKSRSGEQTRLMTVARGVASGHEPVVHFGLGDDNHVDALIVEWPDGTAETFRDLKADTLITLTQSASAAPRPEVTSPPALYRENATERGLAITVARPDSAENEETVQPLMPERFNGAGPGVAVGDVDGDGRMDIYVAGSAGKPGTLFREREDGSFVAEAVLAPDSSTLSAAPLLFDADGDGDLDLLLVSGGILEGDAPIYQDRLLLNDGHGKFVAAAPDAAWRSPTSSAVAAAADFDRDGKLDVFVGGRVSPGTFPAAPESRLLSRRSGEWRNIAPEAAPQLSRAGMITAALWTDADGDGWLDLLVATEWGPLQLFRNEAGATSVERRLVRQVTDFESASGWWSALAAADFDGDGRMDYFAGNAGLNTRYRASREAPALLLASDWGGTGRTVPIEARFDGSVLRPWRGVTDTLRAVGSRRFAAEVLQRLPTFAAYGDASLEEIFTPAALARAQLLAATELRSGVWMNQGGGRFRFVPLIGPVQWTMVRAAAAGDFDGDGCADLVLVGNSHAPSPVAGRVEGGVGLWLRGDGRGGFAALAPTASGLVVPGPAAALVTLDVNLDGRPEFFVTRDRRSTLAFAPVAPPPEEGSERWPFSVELRGGPENPSAIGAAVQVWHRDGRRQVAELRAGSGWSQSELRLFFGAARDNPIERIDVRWPDGEVSHYGWAAHRAVVLRR